MKTKSINDLIDSLVKSFKDYDESLKNKLRANNLFSSLDENTNKNFNKLINLSDLRYKSVKSGVKLNNILRQQKPKYEDLIEELKNDKLYSTNNLDSEKAKLFKSSVIYKNKEILKIRNKLKNSLRPKQNIYLIPKKEKTQSKENLSKLKNIIRRVSNLAFINDFFKKRMKNKKLEKQNEYLINNLILEDYNHFRNKIENYHNFLNKIRNLSENQKSDKKLKIDKNIFKNTIQSLNPKSFIALTYEQSADKIKKKLIKKDQEFDVRKIKNIKKCHDNNFNNILKNKTSRICLTEYNNSKNTNFGSKNKSIISRNVTKDNFSNILNSQRLSLPNNSLDKNKLDNFKNTAYIVMNETEYGLFNEENFLKKKNKLNKFFKDHNKTIEEKAQSLKRKSVYFVKNKEDDNLHKSNMKEKISEIKDYNDKNNEIIRKKLQEVYEQKKLKWKNEDKLNEIKKEKDRQNMDEIENFLYIIQNKKLLRKNKGI